MDKNRCKHCKYYLQHYTFVDGRIVRVYCGHCTYCAARHRRPDAAACDAFLLSSSDEEGFATKTYLTKKLLEHVLKMELLPPIEDATDLKIR